MRLAGIVVTLLIGAVLTVLYLKAFLPKKSEVGASQTAIERTKERVRQVEEQQRRYEADLQDAAR